MKFFRGPLVFYFLMAILGDVAWAAAELSLIPPGINFGTLDTGSTATVTLVLANPGDATLSVSNFNKTGSANFFVDAEAPADPCGSETPDILPGESCEIAVNFSPSATELFTGILEFSSNDPGEPVLTVDLLGSGVGGDCSLGGGGEPGFHWAWLLVLGIIFGARPRNKVSLPLLNE